MTKTSSQTGKPGSARIKYADGPVDRAALLRDDETWMADALAAPASRLLAVWRNRSLVAGLEHGRSGAVRHAIELHVHASQVVFLGLDDDKRPLFAADYSYLDEPAVEALLGEAFVDLRRVGPLLEHRDAAVLAYARGILYWHRNHRYCGRCGSPTEALKGGHLRVCTNADCARSVFPRTDPAVIVLVAHPGDDGGPPRCLLGRSPRFPSGVYSTLAGFVEPGESLEATVRREVFEESGVEVGEVEYLASQPWPFPSSLMIGFHARALTSAIRRHDEELEDARWFTADQLRTAADWGEEARLCLPRRDSIARFLIETWLARVAGGGSAP